MANNNQTKKIAVPSSRDKRNVRYNDKAKRWEFDVRVVRPDGTVFRRAGSAKSESDCLRRRDAARHLFNDDMGAARDAKRKSVREKTDSLDSYTESVLHLVMAKVAPTSFEAYRHALENHVLPVLGHLPLDGLRPSVLAGFLLEVSKNVSPGAASQARNALNQVLRIAAADELIKSNPLPKVDVGKYARKVKSIEQALSGEQRKRWLTQSESLALLDACRDTPAYTIALLGLRFGLRIGESLGLTWQNVDLDAKLLKVCQQVQTLPGKTRAVVPPKSKDSVRELTVPDDLVEELKLMKAQATSEWVVVNESGGLVHPKHVGRVLNARVRAAGFDGKDGRPVPSSHDFRSSYLSWLANYANGGAGVKPHVLAKIAGHSDIQVTMKFYIDADAGDMASAVNSLDWSNVTEPKQESRLDKALEEDDQAA